jgi:multidrug efflux system membrane fusion protein
MDDQPQPPFWSNSRTAKPDQLELDAGSPRGRTAPFDEPGAAPGEMPGRHDAPGHREPPTPDNPEPPSRSGRRSALWLILLLVIIGGLVAWVVLRPANQAKPTGRFQTAGPLPVGTATVTSGDMPVVLSGLGTVTPLATVTVKTRIAGQLTEIAFREGQMVKKGDFLAQIDPRPYQVALEQAQAQLAKDQAALNNAKVDLGRYRTLVAQNSIAKQTLDTQAATVQQDQAVLQADQAQIDTQKLNLVYARITAPIAGRVGLRQVDAGNYLQPTDANGIVVITEIQPISVVFTLPEDKLRAVLQRINEGARLPVTAFDRTDQVKLDSGTLETIDNQIDTSTGTVKLRAIFNNPGLILFPNQFVNVQLLVDTLPNADLVPVSAIERGAPGTFVYVVKPGNTVSVQPVTLGPGQGQLVTVTKGLKPGDKVVTDGADRLKDGAKVKLASGSGASKGAAPAKPAAAPAAADAPASDAPGAGHPALSPSAPAGDHPRRQRGQGGGQHRARETQ